MALQAIILDVEGTMAETDDVKRAAFNQAFAEVGLDWVWSRALYRQIRQNTLDGDEIEYFALLRHPDQFNKLEASGLLGEVPVRQRRIYRDLLEAGAAPLRPGVARLMAEALSERVKLAVCSTGARLDFETLLYTRFGPDMLNALAASVAEEDLLGGSPIEAYSLLLRRLDIAPPDIAVIEDSGPGTAAAARLGMMVLATPGYYTMADNFADAALVLSDLGHPAAPFAVLKGQAPGIGHVTISALRYWLMQSQAGVRAA